MSTASITEAESPRVPEPLGEGDAGSAPGLRIDGPHAFSSAAAEASPSPGVEDSGANLRGAGYDRLLLQAGQIADHLKLQCAELDRREHRLHSQLALLDQERRSVRMWVVEFDALAREREEQLAQRESEVAERAGACGKLEQELQSLHQMLLREQLGLEQRAAQLEGERAQDRQRVAEEREAAERLLAEHRADVERALSDEREAIERERQQFEQELARGRDELARARDELEAEFRQERVLLENRLRFQHDHLQKLRSEFEAAQTAFRVEQQQARAWTEQHQSQLRQRHEQLGRFGALLRQREESLEREHAVLQRTRRGFEEWERKQREQLEDARRQWDHDRDLQQADLRRQQDMLVVHAENLETRRTRLDKLRAELEETNRKTLETRLAVEEAYAQLAQTAGADVARQRVDEARNILAEYYRFTRDGLVQQRQELEHLQARLQQQREEFRAERSELAAWLAEQEQQSRVRTEALARDQAAVDDREQAMRLAREKWLSEKLEAEAVIRDLLAQLTGQVDGSL